MEKSGVMMIHGLLKYGLIKVEPDLEITLWALI